jgi:hypothetical protein
MEDKHIRKSKDLAEPRIGIFWIFEDRIFDMVMEPARSIEGNSISKDSSHAHLDRWEELRAQGKLGRLPQILQDEYFYVPRGRVVFLKIEMKYIIYHGDEFTDLHRELIMNAFKLPPEITEDRVDEHYNPFSE